MTSNRLAAFTADDSKALDIVSEAKFKLLRDEASEKFRPLTESFSAVAEDFLSKRGQDTQRSSFLTLFGTNKRSQKEEEKILKNPRTKFLGRPMKMDF